MSGKERDRNSRKKWLAVLLIVLLIGGTAAVLMARAGGAGGSRSSGGGGGGDGAGELILWVIMLIIHLPFPLNILAAAAVLGGAWFVHKKSKQQSVLNKLPSGAAAGGKVPGWKQFTEANPEFDREQFIAKVKTAFLEIQQAWEAQDLSKVRKFISDGVYQRFNTQFAMMKLLKQKNTIDEVKIKNVVIDKVETDGLYDIIHVAIQATMKDRFVCELDSSLNSGGFEEFVEYWSFLRKRGVPDKDMFNSPACPNCGATIEGIDTEVGKCEFCGSMLNSGEFDWVLSEITQADDYVSQSPKVARSRAAVSAKAAQLVNENEDFSVQLIEDKASNGYLQILTAIAKQEPAVMRRFVADELFDKLQGRIGERQVVYNRIYLNDVTLIGIQQSETVNTLAISVKSSFQRVALEGEQVSRIDPAVISDTEVVLLSRDRSAGKNAGSLYMHNCPGCGAAVEDTLSMECEYCGATFNSTSSEWIITGIMAASEYQGYQSEHSSEFTHSIDPAKLDKLYDVRDYAFNNVMVLFAADGVFHEAEKFMAQQLAKKWGYNLQKLEPMFNMAQSQRLVIRMPENLKQCRKVYRLMERAAAVDGTIDPSEQQLLDSIREQYLSDDEAA